MDDMSDPFIRDMTGFDPFLRGDIHYDQQPERGLLEDDNEDMREIAEEIPAMGTGDSGE